MALRGEGLAGTRVGEEVSSGEARAAGEWAGRVAGEEALMMSAGERGDFVLISRSAVAARCCGEVAAGWVKRLPKARGVVGLREDALDALLDIGGDICWGGGG